MAEATNLSRSNCPISAALEVVGDRWTLLVIRDTVFARARTFRDFLKSKEGIATNILADRLAKLVSHGILSSERDPLDGRSRIYKLTPKGADLVPVVMELSKWGALHEGGVAPDGVLEAWSASREKFLQGIKETL